ncbi:E3 ubiquitin-protein ligase NRDP1-like [Ornithodoros turicata]|uniref:E3 ubiquitin-protein ligase NRDP1-like n=1 Tax=Ornithodoros turicata TaxID=34597 RepID=UPI003139699E
MGYDLCRFQGEVDEELICPVCSGVLEEPLQAPQCEHAFCKGCIGQWLSRQATCPVDRQPITSAQLKPVPRILRNLLSRLQLSCDNAQFGCNVVVKLDNLATHRESCEHNPRRPVPCDQGCGLVIPKDQLKDHNCVKELRGLVQSQQQRLSEFQAEIREQWREINILKEYIRSMRAASSPVPPLSSLIPASAEQDEVIGWAGKLQRARVTRWGGMISTPDAVLQAMVKRALTDSGCPQQILQSLIDNAHERRWPPGLSTLETRQMNRRHYESYVCKRIPGKQAVVVVACENQHMNEDMVLEPGLVMIFAHGIE